MCQRLYFLSVGVATKSPALSAQTPFDNVPDKDITIGGENGIHHHSTVFMIFISTIHQSCKYY